MKKTKLMVLTLVLIIVSFGITWSAPRLTINNDSFDFGFIPQHSKVSHVFWLHSTGDDELKILKVLPG